MDRSSFVSLLVVSLFFSACATSSSNLKPGELSNDKGAFFGHIQVFNQNEDVTSSCYVEFTDSEGHRKQYTSLDKTGWIFTSVVPGDTYLSMAICTVGGLMKRNIQFNTRELKFAVSDQLKMSYFGHVAVHMDYDGSVPVVAFLGGAIAGAIAATPVNAAKAVTVENRFQEASKEYYERYGATAKRLELVSRVVSWTSQDRMPASVGVKK